MKARKKGRISLAARVALLTRENRKLRAKIQALAGADVEAQELRTAWDIQRQIAKQYSDQLEEERVKLHRGVRKVMANMVARASPAMAKILTKRKPEDR